MTAPSAHAASWLVRSLALAAVVGALLVGFVGVLRPWYRNWGATREEMVQVFPGDELVSGPPDQETRAITIHAPIARVWGWVAQIGQDRGGFYSFDLLENLVGCDMPTVDSLRPEMQQWMVGDRLWMYPERSDGGVGFATLRAYIPGRLLVFGTHVVGTEPGAPEDGSWGFVLSPIDSANTRLVVRGRGARGRSLLGVAFDRGIFEPIHFVMERRMMTGVRDLAERGDRQRWANHLQILLWATIFFFTIFSGVRVFSRREWWRSLAGFVSGALIFQLLTLGQPPIAIGVVVALVGIAGIRYLDRGDA